MFFLTTPVLQCLRLCLMERVYSLWRIPCISTGSGTPVLTVNLLSIKLDGIAPFISPVLSESPVPPFFVRTLPGGVPVMRHILKRSPTADKRLRLPPSFSCIAPQQ